VDASTYGTKMPRASWEFIGDMRVPCPDEETQSQICDFLQDNLSSIERIIKYLNDINGLSNKKRETIITRTFRTGLNDDIELKPTSWSWLGQIPSHWEITKLKYLAEVQTGVTKGEYKNEEELVSVPYLRVANVQDGYLDLSNVKEINIPPTEVDRYLLEPGDVLMNEGGDYDKLGRGTVWNGEISPCVHQNHVFCVRPNSTEYSEWISKLTESKFLKHYFIRKSKQSTNLASISVSDIKETPIILPPAKEREDILDHVDNEEKQLDHLERYTDKTIDLLQEKRRALIAAAITGKINVPMENESDQELPA
jgi:type I restriction enzyme S subunit